MKKTIHPKYFPETKVTCACGNVFTIGSTQANLEVEICSSCHPFFTGNEKVMDIAGRVEKFKTRASKASESKTTKKKVASAKTVVSSKKTKK
ncbi:MAG: 50S ribosomal protein L31 [Candidatus Vogelbacteria bacterium CG22_combo_CG10-13_8_21_14_all_37_9]|uniref:Large ribosomal subunit protein bL31 n=1 Tax=Candidatus Vogelbacteria bacterium CG22_combo_CG10-13_8_21_14_all_37_9 TaxID=1975046 RepID=A0A2H0BLA0_9BACT|nr:MAG: 50S ribosomal protein L31 [bacterium CG10_37_50]PIP58374.1 MAG: 50S ribosomal protein L31 [Candidatus Vogelbacteria bacterium CG22_combo_CG10-13_8_21_14_all_37_9]